MANCPYCKKPLLITRADPLGVRQPSAREYYQTTQPIPAGSVGITPNAQIPTSWQEISYSEPVREANKESDVYVPLFQALITGLFVALGLGLVVGVMGSYQSWPWWSGFAAAGVSFVFVSLWKWQDLLTDSRDLLRKVETIVARDLDGDGMIGQPQPAPSPEPVKIEIVKEKTGARQTLFSDLPCNVPAFRSWAEAAIHDRSLAIGTWTGAGRPFSRSEYEQLMAIMEQAGIVSPPTSQGRKPRRPGRAALKQYLKPIN